MRRSVYLRALALFALLALVVMASAQRNNNNRREEDAPASKPPAAAAAAPAPPVEKNAAPAKKGSVRGFIRVSGNKFVDENCGDFIPIGWNSWVDLNRQATRVAGNAAPGTPLERIGDNYVTKVFDQAKEAGFNLVRVFGHGEETSFMLQTAPGQYNEQIFRGLDYINAVAGSRGIRVLFVPINMWLSPHVGDGFGTYVEWAGLPVSQSDKFWTDGRIKGMVKNHFSTLLNRRNVFSGLQWKDDPAIFGFDLFNEPRCPFGQDKSGCPKEVTSWVVDMSEYIKGIDRNHLTTVGEEGFFEYDSGNKEYGPWGIPENVAPMGRYWSASVGQDFTAQHAPASIDFAAIHMWPDNWNTTDLAFPPVWIDSHIKESRKLGKPLLLEEFGKQSNGAGDKAPYYDVVFSALETSLANGDNFRGALFWRWAADGGNDATTVQTGDATWNTIMRITKNINTQWQGKKVAGCDAAGKGGGGDAAPVAAAPVTAAAPPSSADASDASAGTGGGTVAAASIRN